MRTFNPGMGYAPLVAPGIVRPHNFLILGIAKMQNTIEFVREHNLIALSSDTQALQRQQFKTMQITYAWLERQRTFEYDLTVLDDVQAAKRLLGVLELNRVHAKITLN